MTAASVLPVPLLTLALLTRLPAPSFIPLIMVAVVLVSLALTTTLLALLAPLVALALVPPRSALPLTALILIVLLSHGVSFSDCNGVLAKAKDCNLHATTAIGSD